MFDPPSFFFRLRWADWNECAVKAAALVRGHSGFSLVETAPSSPQNGSDSDSDPDSCTAGEGGGGSGVPAVPWWGREDEDEEGGVGYYGGGGRGAVLGVGERTEWVHAGESSKLVAAGPHLPRPRQC